MSESDSTEYLILLDSSSSSAAAMALSGLEGASGQASLVKQLGLQLKGHWLVLGNHDVALLVSGDLEAVLAFQLSAQSSGQRVEVMTLLPVSTAGGVTERLLETISSVVQPPPSSGGAE